MLHSDLPHLSGFSELHLNQTELDLTHTTSIH
jgi:hypothetical protein